MSDQIVRLITPDSVKATGKPEAFRVVKDGATYALPWGADFRISSHCDPDGRVANLDAKGGYALLHKDFYTQHESKFKPINHQDDA